MKKRHFAWLIISLFLVAFLINGCEQSSSSCGNGFCENLTENETSCPLDCSDLPCLSQGSCYNLTECQEGFEKLSFHCNQGICCKMKIGNAQQCVEAGYYCGKNSLYGGCGIEKEVGLCQKSIPCCKGEIRTNNNDNNSNQSNPFCGDLTELEILDIAEHSECTDNATLNTSKEFYCNNYNMNHQYAWVGLNLIKTGCNPACVIDTKLEEAEINWRCTGANPENNTNNTHGGGGLLPKCTKTGTNETLNMTEATRIYRDSECNEPERVIFSPFICDKTRGIYWIDLNVSISPGNATSCNSTCVPSCSVLVVEKNASIDCRC